MIFPNKTRRKILTSHEAARKRPTNNFYIRLFKQMIFPYKTHTGLSPCRVTQHSRKGPATNFHQNFLTRYITLQDAGFSPESRNNKKKVP